MAERKRKREDDVETSSKKQVVEPEKPLAGRVAVVTGGANGIGKSCAVRLAKEGAKVMIADFDKEMGPKTAAEINSMGYTAEFQYVDVTDAKLVQQCFDTTVQKFGGVHILVNNAVRFLFGHLGPTGTGSKTHTDREITQKDWTTIMNTNVVGYASCIKEACKHMIKNDLPQLLYPQDHGEGKSVINAGSRGAIVNIASVSSYIAQPEFVPYNATKAAILSMTKCCAKDFAKYKIRVNAICPGTVETKGSYGHMKAINLEIEEGRKVFGDSCEMKRQGAPEEIANVVYFLASDESSFMTGAHVIVDGGGTI